MEFLNSKKSSRRAIIKSSLFGAMAVSIPNILYARDISPVRTEQQSPQVFQRYPSIDDEIVNEIVGASHFNFDRVKELVTKRPELARATWDWAFGDWETALGAASHVGRRDIAKFLIDNGARPDIFTFAMFGQYEIVQRMINSMPGVEAIDGPHGISLLSHAKAGLRSNYGTTLSKEAEEMSNKTIEYLEKLGTANPQAKNIPMSEEAMAKYIGDYRYGEGDTEGFTIALNMRKMLSLGKLGKSGGGLFQKAPNVFTYNGNITVEIKFEVVNEQVLSLTVVEPDLTLKAVKV